MASRLIVISPEDDLRHSLEFALQAEGYGVVATTLPDAMRSLDGFDCFVVDEKSFDGSRVALTDFCTARRPVVLLTDNPGAYADLSIDEVVEKPLRGGAVHRAVRNTLECRHGTTT